SPACSTHSARQKGSSALSPVMTPSSSLRPATPISKSSISPPSSCSNRPLNVSQYAGHRLLAVPPERKIPAKAGIFVFCAQVNADLLALCHQKIFRGGKEGRTSHCCGEAQQVIEMAALPLVHTGH